MYATVEDLEKALTSNTLAQLTDDENGLVINNQIVEDAIKKADSIIDAYLRSRYQLPINPIPDILRDISIRLAKYFLYRRRLDLDLPDTVSKEYDTAMGILKDLQSGKAVIPIANEIKVGNYAYSKKEEIFKELP